MKKPINTIFISLLFAFILSTFCQETQAWGHHYKLRLMGAKAKPAPVMRRTKLAIKTPMVIVVPPVLTEIIEQAEIDEKALNNDELTGVVIVEKPIVNTHTFFRHRLNPKKAIKVAVEEVSTIPVQQIKEVPHAERTSTLKTKAPFRGPRTLLGLVLVVLLTLLLLLLLGTVGVLLLLLILLILLLAGGMRFFIY